jgi:hypothetical protein
MRRLLVLGFSTLLSLCFTAAAQQGFEGCLPKGVKSTEIVSAQFSKPGRSGRKTTVAQKLLELKAHCKRGKLVDARGREIYFYRMTGCWGNPPSDYLEILDRQSNEIRSLKKRYTVIEMTCNPSGEPIP